MIYDISHRLPEPYSDTTDEERDDRIVAAFADVKRMVRHREGAWSGGVLRLRLMDAHGRCVTVTQTCGGESISHAARKIANDLVKLAEALIEVADPELKRGREAIENLLFGEKSDG